MGPGILHALAMADASTAVRASRLERHLEVAVIVAAIVTIPVIIAQELDVRGWAISVLDWAIWVVFAADLATGLTLAVRRGQRPYLRRRWLNFAVVVLTLPVLPELLKTLRLVRLVRVARVLRVLLVEARALRALRSVFTRRGFAYVAGIAGLLIVTGGALMAVVEPETVRGGMWDGIWWAIVTASTVGYGDIAPESLGGRILATLLILAGIGVVGTLAASVAAYFVGEDESARLREVEERLRSIESLLRELRTSRPGDRSGGHGAPARDHASGARFAAPQDRATDGSHST